MFSSQGVAVLGIALIAMGEEIGSEMALRTFGHLVSITAYLRFSVFVLFLFPLTEYVIVPPFHHLSVLNVLIYITFFLPLRD